MKPELGVCYYPEHWEEKTWPEDARRMRETGISWVRIGEFAWSRLEPREGEFHWGWLDRAVEVLAGAGLKIVMGTPSATPPRWVLTKFPDMLALDKEGRPRKFGSRRHYCFSHQGYRGEAARMAGAMAKRYGAHEAIKAWQIDNEYGCHDTTLSYSKAALHGFREWLEAKYATIGALNRAWGNVFWSMEYAGFDEIELPNLTVTEANPTHQLDFRRYSSQAVVDFNQAQIAAIRPHTDGPLIHNYMGRVTDFDHFALGNDLEIAAWDSYPMGFLEAVLREENNQWKLRYAHQGDPDFQAFHHDLYRAVGKGRWWVMEQQPGPVNWAPYNPIPLDGMVKLWGMEAIAHGAEVVSYFRWRQAPFAQEQMHAGLLRPDGENARAQIEVRELAGEIQLMDIEHSPAEVAIIFDYESQWAWEIQPQGKGFDYFRLVFEQYRALRAWGLNIDFLPATTRDFGACKLVLIPGLMAWNDALREAIAGFNGIILAGPRTGQKTRDFHIPQSLGPDFAGVKVLRVASLRPGDAIKVKRGIERDGKITRWFEEVEGEWRWYKTEAGLPVVAKSNDERLYYLAGWLDQESYSGLFDLLFMEAGISPPTLPEGLRRRQAGRREFICNYGPEPVEYRGNTIPPASYIWRDL